MIKLITAIDNYGHRHYSKKHRCKVHSFDGHIGYSYYGIRVIINGKIEHVCVIADDCQQAVRLAKLQAKPFNWTKYNHSVKCHHYFYYLEWELGFNHE